MSVLTTDAAAFAETLPGLGRLLSLDIGTRTIGLATASADWRFATARETLKRTKPGADMEALRQLAAKEEIRGLVIGLPLNMDGSDSERTQSVRAQARNLSKGLGLPILLWDERWSTASAESALIAQDMSRAKRAERIDSHAAAVILQAAIDALAGGFA